MIFIHLEEMFTYENIQADFNYGEGNYPWSSSDTNVDSVFVEPACGVLNFGFRSVEAKSIR